MAKELDNIECVYLGTVMTADKKRGDLWTTRERAEAATTSGRLLDGASAFSKGRKTRVVGGVYEMPAEVDDDGRLTRLSAEGPYRDLIENDIMAGLALAEKGREAQEAAKRAEQKASRDGSTKLLLDRVATIIASAPPAKQELIIQGFAAEVRRRALAKWRSSARGRS